MRAISWNIGKNFKIIDQQLKIVDEEKAANPGWEKYLMDSIDRE